MFGSSEDGQHHGVTQRGEDGAGSMRTWGTPNGLSVVLCETTRPFLWKRESDHGGG